MVKKLAAITGYSESGIRRMIREDRVMVRRVGGRVLVNADTIPRKVTKEQRDTLRPAVHHVRHGNK